MRRERLRIAIGGAYPSLYRALVEEDRFVAVRIDT